VNAPELDTSNPPTVPPKVRTIAYCVALVTGALGASTITTTASLAAAGVMDGTTALVVAAISGGVLSTVGTIAGGLGVAYRPR
jgi:hypothetical protein